MPRPRRRYEPQHVLLGGGSYFAHAWGSVYVLSGRVASDLAAIPSGALRRFANEGALRKRGWQVAGASTACKGLRLRHDCRSLLASRAAVESAAGRRPAARPPADVTIGSWLLAFNASHFDDRRLCEPACSATSLAVYDIPKCAGLCDAASQLPAMHATAECRAPPAGAATGELPLLKPLFDFGGGGALQAAGAA